jgi:aminobenzoyl-glutamate utilization protein B
MRKFLILILAAGCAFAQNLLAQNRVSPEKEASIKADLSGQIDAMKKQAQVMVDSVFSFGELGFQEFETSKYLTGILEKNGFKIERNYAGIPTAFVASWGEGKPVISLGSDIDDIPQASQKPGVAWHEPMIEGAPGHGEGHNSGMPLNILAALAVKQIMEREHLKGTIRLWPGVAEEDLGTKAGKQSDGFERSHDERWFGVDRILIQG